ncbi:MAG TPA: hypothetical protein DHV14_10820 [Micrococcales bacterium]|uniref:hypothetical protein n=1 Tax=Miniimonas TaxID=947525 RepID=UPI000D52A227|nr:MULTISPECIES: hypothetical protein [Miniimonas]HCX85604.1 hypothetical protein [Micrococcales bacterium]
MDRFSVDIGMVNTASYAWREEANVLAGGATTMGAVSATGVGDGVEDAVSTFLTTWAQYASDQSTLADSMADRLDEAAKAYTDSDYAAQDAFAQWLEGEK